MHFFTPRNPLTPPPPEWTDLQLCRLYGCRPSELMQEDWATISMHLRLLAVESEHQEQKRGRAPGSAKAAFFGTGQPDDGETGN